MMNLNRKHQEEESFYGHGQTWFRGQIIAKETSGPVYIAYTSLKKPAKRPRVSDNNTTPAIFTVKSSISDSGLMHESMVLDKLYGCPHIRQMLGEEFTLDVDNGKLVSNLLLEYCSGGTLGCLIRKNGGKGLPEASIRTYTKHILLGLARIHKEGFVWGGLNLETVLLVPNGDNNAGTEYIAKIGDLGLAGTVEERKGKNLRSGDKKYMAPETWAENVQEPCSDIWALACVVIEMLQGYSTWDEMEESEIEDVLFDIANDNREAAVVCGTLSSEGRDFLMKSLAKKEDRSSAEELLNHPFVTEKLTEGNEIDRVLEAVEEAVEEVNTATRALESSREALESMKEVLEAAKEAVYNETGPEEELEVSINTATQSYNSYHNEDAHENSRSFQDDDEEEEEEEEEEKSYLGSVLSSSCKSFDDGSYSCSC